MRLYRLRILVALFAFAAGVAAASLWGFLRAPLACPAYSVDADAPRPVTVAAPPTEPTSEPSLAKDASLERCRLGQMSLDAFELFSGGRNSQGTNLVRGLAQGRAVHKFTPRYPPEAKAAGVGGVVKVQLVVDEEGGVMTARAVSGHELLRDTAVDAACRSRFSPQKLSGRPVKVTGVITFNFVLQ